MTHKALVLMFVLSPVVTLGGCYQQLYDAVVDPSDTSPGGTVATTLSGQAIGTVPGLASGNPMVITGTSETFLLALTAGDDAEGHDAHDTLAVASATITLPIDSSSRSNLQLHYNGVSCLAITGQIVLTTDTTLHVSGSFSGTGSMAGSTEPCTVSGSLTSIPQSTN